MSSSGSTRQQDAVHMPPAPAGGAANGGTTSAAAAPAVVGGCSVRVNGSRSDVRRRRRRRQEGSDSSSSSTAVLALAERWDLRALSDLLGLVVGALNEPVVAVLKTARKRLGADGMLEVSYHYGTKTPGAGRLYASSVSLQRLPGRVRRLLAGSNYHDVDMVNALPTLLLHLAQHYQTGPVHSSMPVLARYVAQREEFLEELMQRGGISRSEAKTAVLTTINFGGTRVKSPKLDALAGEIGRLYDCMAADDALKHLKAAAAASAEADPSVNEKASFLCHVCFDLEAKVLKVLKKTLEMHGLEVGCLVFDGLLVRKTADSARILEEQALPKAEAAIRAAFGGTLHMKLLEKPLAPSKEDLEFVTRKTDLQKKRPVERCLWLLKRHARQHGLVRHGEFIYRPSEHLPNVFLRIKELERFINDVLRDDEVFGATPVLKPLLEWLTNAGQPRVPTHPGV
eukprot:m.268386 g.268386  ORF g.268386 m.268386 type:complete len:455 (-) comp11076_c1_seq1:2513-3877(-)